MLTLFLLYWLVHPSRYLSIFPSNRAYINNNNNNENAIYAPMDDYRPCFLYDRLIIIITHLFAIDDNTNS